MLKKVGVYMLAAKTLKAFDIKVEELPKPDIKDDEVLIKVGKSGICGSDMQIYHGLHKYMTFPVIQGHEGGGFIEAVGSKVTNVEVGDKVVVQPQLFCGECYACKNGRYNVCSHLKVLGVHADGLFAEYITLPSWNVIKVPDHMDFNEISLIEPLAVGIGGASKANPQKGKGIMVLGAGIIGNFTAQACKAFGADVIITDIDNNKLDLAKKQGIAYTVNTLEEDLGQAIEKFSKEKGVSVDAIIDCAATEATFRQAVKHSENSSTIVIVGNYKAPVEMEIPQLQRREVALLGSMMYVREDFEKAIEFLANKSINIENMITKEFDLDDIGQAFKWVDENTSNSMKVLVNVSN